MATGKVAARAGEQYDLYAYIQGELDADTTQGRFLIRAKFMDSNGASLGYSDITAMYPGAISSWTRVGGRVTAPANSVSMQVQYLLYMSSGWVNIDDVEVTIVPPNAATEITKYYMFGGQRVAMRKNGVLTYLHADHLGSTVLETNITGTVTSDEKYLAYGKQRDSGKVSTDHRFTGQKEDASGLQYFNARFYDPVIGMFVSPDTIVPQPGLASDYNRYLYARGNPLRSVDPSGHCVVQGLPGSDTGENQQCWNAATQIAGLMQNDPDNPAFHGESRVHFVGQVAPHPLVTLGALQGILDAYWTNYYVSAGVHHVKYNPAPVMNPVPPGANFDVGTPMVNVLKLASIVCNFGDCPAIVLDGASLGSSVMQSGSVTCAATGVGAPVCVPSAAYWTYVDASINIASVGYEGYGYANDEKTMYDLSMTLTDVAVKPVVKPLLEALGAGASSTPYVGVAYDTFMLFYDLFIDPFVRTPGAAGTAK